MLYELKLNGNIESPYVCCRSQSPWTPVSRILLKVCPFSDKEFTNGNGTGMNKMNETKFRNEVSIQNEIFTKSLDETLEPICPSIVFNCLSTVESFRNMLKLKNMDETLLNMPEITAFGLIAMEYLEGFEPLGKLIFKDPPVLTDEQNKYYKLLAAYELIRMYNLTEYLHGDLHLNNFMINTNYTYIGNTPSKLGRVLIIDFGESFKLDVLLTGHKLKLDFDDNHSCANILKLNKIIIPLLGIDNTKFINPDNLVIKIGCDHEIGSINDSPWEKSAEHGYYGYNWINVWTNVFFLKKDLFKMMNDNRNETIDLWKQTISSPMNVSPLTGGKTEIMNRMSLNTNHMDVFSSKMPKKRASIKKPISQPMFPQYFTGKAKEIQAYVAAENASVPKIVNFDIE